MKLLVHGMQSSGATSFALFLAQRPDCLALVDIANNFAAPRIVPPMDMVAKTVVTTAYPWAVHVERFRPDRTILLLRDPRDNYASLATKNYRNYSGLIDEKFLLADQIFAERGRFDTTILYEDFVARDPAVMTAVNGLGWPVEEAYFSYTRRHEEIIADLWRHAPHLVTDMDFTFGNVRGREVSPHFRDKPRSENMETLLDTLCPRLLAHYRNRAGA